MDVVAIFSFKSHELILTSFFIYQHVILDEGFQFAYGQIHSFLTFFSKIEINKN